MLHAKNGFSEQFFFFKGNGLTLKRCVMSEKTRKMEKQMRNWSVLLIALLCLMVSSFAGCGKKEEVLTYERFKQMAPEEQKKTFAELSGPQIYALVAGSDENWPVKNYDLITPENAKETIVLIENQGNLHFNLAWPPYGGFLPESIASIGELTGTLDVSRDGGDSGHSMASGKNADGSYPNDSERSVPKSSASVRTGILNVDQYKKVLDIVANGKDEDSRIKALAGLGYSADIARRFIEDQSAFPSRDEVSGPKNINDGALSAGHTVDGKYGYYGTTAPWNAGDLHLKGGAGQLCTVLSWGVLCDSGLISNTGTAEIH